jgi:hypothetical protein
MKIINEKLFEASLYTSVIILSSSPTLIHPKISSAPSNLALNTNLIAANWISNEDSDQGYFG